MKENIFLNTIPISSESDLKTSTTKSSKANNTLITIKTTTIQLHVLSGPHKDIKINIDELIEKKRSTNHLVKNNNNDSGDY